MTNTATGKKARSSSKRSNEPADTYAVSTHDLLRLFTQNRALHSEFSDLWGFQDDVEHVATPRSRDVTLRVRITDAAANSGAWASQRIVDELAVVRGMLRRVHLELVDPDTEDWRPSISDLHRRYFDCLVRKQGNGKVLVHSIRGAQPDLTKIFR